MYWKTKGLLQKIIGMLPAGETLHYQLQRRFGGMRDFRREFLLKVDDWESMIQQLQADGLRIEGARLMEIGTGWYPTLPLACHLAGAARVDTLDLNRMLKPDLVRQCVVALGEQLERIARVSGADPAAVEARYRKLAASTAFDDPTALTDGVVRYRAPADATRPELPDHSVDAVFSNSVLEHVPPDVLHAICAASMRILVPGGRMFHSVNCGDHYAYVDRNIHQLHYLQFSDEAWAFWNNRFLYQNRLRAHEFVDAARDAGFSITLDTSHARPQRLEQLRAMTVAARFQHIPAEKLCITTVDFIGRTPDAPAA